MSQGFKTSLARYGVSTSAGVHNGKRFAVWDTQARKVVAWRASFAAAQKASKALNARDKESN